MDRTNYEHAAIAVVIQIILMALFALSGQLLDSFFVVLAASLPGPFTFFGREHAQRERELQDRYKTPPATWAVTLEALRFWEWDTDSKLDFACPVVAVTIVGLGCWALARI